MKRLFIILYLIFNLTSNLTNWDLRIMTDVFVDLRMETISIPFEGFNQTNNFNRTFEPYYGTIHRRFDENGNFKDSQIVLHQWLNTNNNQYLASCFAEVQVGYTNWGFAKYLITFKNLSDTNKTIRFYFNSLDSKCGFDSIPGHGYHQDITINYFGNAVTPYVKVSMDRDTTRYRIVYRSSTPQEVTMWDLFYNRTTPLEKDFKVRTTPFPLSYNSAQNQVRDIIVGTKIVLDTVYKNLGNSDRYGFNTQNDPYYDDPNISPGMNDPGNTFCTPAVINFLPSGDYFGMKLTAENGDTLILEKNKKLWISGISANPPLGDTIHFKPGSTLILKESAEIFTYSGGVRIIDGGTNVNWNQHACNRAFTSTTLVYNGGTHTINNGGFLVIDGGAKLILGDNTTLTFDGASSPLILQPNSQVICGSNSKLEFKNGAHIRANGSTFSCPNGSWQGITLENSTYDTIKNCTFSNASTYIDMSLNSSTANEKKIITGNTFNTGKVKINNSYNLYFAGNTFNSLTTGGYLLQMSHNLSVLGESVSNINITGNAFKGGAVQMDLDGYASSVTKYYIAGNTFYGLTNSPYGVCMLANKISGDFKNNTFIDNHYSTGIQLTNSNINFLNNTIRTTSNNNVYLQTSSSGNFAPVVINEQGGLAYTGGYNQMYYDNSNSQTGEHANIFNGLGNSFFVVLGHNCFNIQNITPNYHIYGYRNGPCIEDPIWVTYNYWSQSPPKTLITCEETPVEIITTPADQSCTNFSELSASDYIITYMGDGIYDSVKVVNAPSGDDAGLLNKPSAASYSVPADKLLYGLCVKHNKTHNYLLSSVKAKELIDNFGSSDYIYSGLDELYMSYKGLDTIPGNTNSLFSELQTYIESKMNQYNSSARFVEKAYNIYLMCLVMKKQYASAISGYENIMNNHPDPVVRLTASWDRSAVVLLMGQGGSQSSLSFLRKQESRLSDRNPDRIARKIFKSSGEESENRTASEKYSTEEKSLINERAVKFNPSTKTEFDEKISQDKALLLALNNDAPSNRTNIIPKRFTLHQNYPNPFNPTTTIKYDIPKDGFISLKVYDVLGREIFSVNEFKKAGSHETVFDGSGFASGVYFYSLESNGLKETKKMLLIK
jgi:hypothetical protein